MAKEMEDQEKTDVNIKEKEPVWGTPEIPGVLKRQPKAPDFNTEGAPMSAADALLLLDKPTTLKCPSGVRYGIRKVSAKAMAMLFRELGTESSDFSKNSMAMLGNIEKFIPIIHEHIESPVISVDKLPGSDLSHILTYMIYEVSGAKAEEQEDLDESFRE